MLIFGAVALTALTGVASTAAGGRSEAAVGAGAGSAPSLPTTIAEAEARYAETAHKCRLLSVAAVRDECLREAKRALDRDLERLKRGSAPV